MFDALGAARMRLVNEDDFSGSYLFGGRASGPTFMHVFAHTFDAGASVSLGVLFTLNALALAG